MFCLYAEINSYMCHFCHLLRHGCKLGPRIPFILQHVQPRSLISIVSSSWHVLWPVSNASLLLHMRGWLALLNADTYLITPSTKRVAWYQNTHQFAYACATPPKSTHRAFTSVDKPLGYRPFYPTGQQIAVGNIHIPVQVYNKTASFYPRLPNTLLVLAELVLNLVSGTLKWTERAHGTPVLILVMLSPRPTTVCQPNRLDDWMEGVMLTVNELQQCVAINAPVDA